MSQKQSHPKWLCKEGTATNWIAAFTIFTYKGITNITYNYLNLPTKIEWGTTKSIEFTYTAAGEKVEKRVKTGVNTDYLQTYVGGIEYNAVAGINRRIESIYHSEGRYFNTNTGTTAPTYRNEYTIKDHLGNARVTFTDKNGDGKIDVTNTASTNEIIQENHYYAFGLNHEGPWLMNDAAKDNGYQYNGKELNGDHGLKWNDFGARWYDATIGRWGQVDPLSEVTASWNSYHYTYNNPLIYTDPTGETGILTLNANGIATVSMELKFHGDGLPKGFDASKEAKEIEEKWNKGGGTVNINGKEYKVNFSISGSVISNAEKNRLSNIIDKTDNKEVAKINFVDVSLKNKSDYIKDPNEIVLQPKSLGTTTPAHEVGHLLGLNHQKEDANNTPKDAGLMSTMFSSVLAKYTLDGKDTKWDSGKIVEGFNDKEKRIALASEVNDMVKSSNRIQITVNTFKLKSNRDKK